MLWALGGCGSSERSERATTSTPSSKATAAPQTAAPATAAAPAKVGGTKVYDGGARGYSIAYPESWEVREIVKGGARVAFLAPAPDGAPTGVRENYNVLVEPAPPTPVATWLGLQDSAVAREGRELRVVETGDATVAGRPGAARLLEARSEQSGVVRMRQYAVAVEDRIFAITYTTEPETWAAGLPRFEELMRTLQIR